MNIKKALILASIFMTSTSIYASELTPEKFISCYKKAVNERIQEIKEENPEAELCDQMSSTEVRLLDSLYLDEFILDGEYVRFRTSDILNASVQTHYDLIKREKQKYDISCYESRFHLLRRTDLDLIEEALEKMFNTKLGFRGWSKDVKELDYSYCM
ncbi:hypothetical protein BIY24_05600 [Halobacteriovorax marinus]|uniref:hypothetical protein n=1 Tax=Halobacteriovorax marinus TaxID=97084 RepID=UPI000BC3098B|nr:hypothetical protein [Halobacteriovorax marinus]ATH07433.1 hypothetical protein BIY24_05600 [Halobacteriovorax marinus]